MRTKEILELSAYKEWDAHIVFTFYPASGALIGKIREDATDSFIIGESREVQPPQSGRLYLGINEDRTSDNESVFRA